MQFKSFCAKSLRLKINAFNGDIMNMKELVTEFDTSASSHLQTNTGRSNMKNVIRIIILPLTYD